MRPDRRFICLALLLLAVYGTPSHLRADATCEGAECDLLILLGITEEPDPVFWESLEAGGSSDLNPGGADRGDGLPHFSIDADDGYPMAVWAYNLGSSSEIAFSEWNGESWTPSELLTTDAEQDDSPVILGAPDGRARIVWSRVVSGVSTIWIIDRMSGSDQWREARQLLSAGRRPSIVVDGMTIMVAYERDAVGGGTEVVVHTSDGKGVEATTQVITSTDRTERLDVQIHQLHGAIWMDWKHSDDQIGYVRLIDGAWSDQPTFVPWLDSSWVGVEFVRREILVGL